MAAMHCLAERRDPTLTAKQCMTAGKAMYFLTEKDNSKKVKKYRNFYL